MTRPFLITGCGRSGTRYISDLLTSLGLHTSWEGVLQPLHRTHRARDFVWLLHRRRLRGDSCWLSVPYLVRLPQEVQVCQVVRHPLSVIRSFLAIRFFGDAYLDLPPVGDPQHMILPYAHIPELAKEPTAIHRCMRYWLGWNQLCERLCLGRRLPLFRYRLEDLAREPESVLGKLLPIIGCRKKLDGMTLTVSNRSAITYAYGQRTLTWQDLPDCSLKESVLSMAESYGYL